MRALVVLDGKVKFVPDAATPAPRANEVAVDVTVAGICATDLEILRGYMQFRGVPGHEFVGLARSGRLKGRRVVGEINASCGACSRCAEGRDRHCANRTVLGILGRDGAFAETLTLPECNLREVPDSVEDDCAVFTEPLAAAYAILEQVEIRRGERVAVLGDGRLGILCAMVLADAGARVTHIGKYTEKLAITRALGIDGMQIDAGKTVAFSDSLQFPVVVEATGSASGLELAIQLTEPRGKLILKTTVNDAPHGSLARLVIDEITVVGSRCGRFEPALAALAAGRIDPRPLVHARYPLERAQEAFAHAESRGTLKVLFEVSKK